MAQDIDNIWRKLVEGQSHVFLAKELYSIFINTINSAYAEKLIHLDERNIRFVDSKNSSDLSEVSSLYCFSRFKECSSGKFIGLDTIAMKLKRVAYSKEDAEMVLANQVLDLYPLIFSLKYIRNTHSHNKEKITDSYFICWVASVVSRIVRIINIDGEKSKIISLICDELLFSSLAIPNKTPHMHIGCEEIESKEKLEEEPLPILSKTEATTALRELRADIKMFFLDKRIMISTDQNILQKRVVDTIERNQISSFDKLLGDEIFISIYKVNREEFDTQIKLFSAQIDQVLTRTDYLS